jgi:hypothetical protein
MATTTPTLKPTDPTPLYALVGATDLAVEGVRHALADAARRQAEVQAEVQAQVEHLQAELGKRRAEVSKLLTEPKRLQAELEQVPGLVLGRTLEAAAKAETRYEELAERGKSLLERLSTQRATQDLVSRGKVTISRTKAAVTTARNAAGDIAVSARNGGGDVVASARDTLAVGRRQAAVAVDDTTASATESAETVKEAAQATAATARKSTVRTRAATKRATTSARKTATTATTAARNGAEKVGD